MAPVRHNSLARQAVLGALIGSAVAIFPIEISLLGSVAALIFLLIRGYWLSLAVAVGLCVLAVQLPLHRLDRKVPPFAYSERSMGNLVAELRENQDISVIIDPELESNVVTFSVSRRSSRREVLEWLAFETGSDLSFRSCASAASLLFGSFKVAYLSAPRSSSVPPSGPSGPNDVLTSQSSPLAD